MSSRGDYAKYRNDYLYAEWLVTLQSPLYDGRKYPHKKHTIKGKNEKMSIKIKG